MDGFITAYQASQNLDKTPVPMRFNRPVDIPITAALARNYTVCDHWFAAVPADTQPNRMMALSGETLIDATPGSLTLFKAEHTVLDWLASKNLDFKIYVDAKTILDVGPPSNLLLMPSQWGHVLAHGEPLDGLAEPWKSDAPAPKFIYCEPFYNDFATVLGQHGNCNHPPLPVGYGEDFLRRVYETLTSNPRNGDAPCCIVCYDEHGGFFARRSPRGEERRLRQLWGSRDADGEFMLLVMAHPLAHRGYADVPAVDKSMFGLDALALAGGGRMPPRTRASLARLIAGSSSPSRCGSIGRENSGTARRMTTSERRGNSCPT